MTAIPFLKMNGSGNDFIMIDNRADLVPDERKPAFARRWCPRRTAVGADGVIFLEDDPDFDFRWSFWNADGSEAEMCGNGARCMALFARERGAAGERMTFRTVAGPIEAEIVPGGARVRMTDATLPERIEGLPVGEDASDLYFLNTGVPHAVIPVPDAEAADVVATGRAIRHHERFRPAGTNVNFMARADANAVVVRTYERGVEDETLACGTGAVASAITACRLYEMASPVAVIVRSGSRLRISFEIKGETVTDVFLEGPAARVYEGALDPD